MISALFLGIPPRNTPVSSCTHYDGIFVQGGRVNTRRARTSAILCHRTVLATIRAILVYFIVIPDISPATVDVFVERIAPVD